MSRQHCTPILLGAEGEMTALTPLSLHGGDGALSEADLQALVHAHPQVLPISEIDPSFAQPVPICRELVTPSGAIDNFMVTPSGAPVLIECKLWRNPEGRREVIGQILDYAKAVSLWSSSDLQREVSVALRREGGGTLLDKVRASAPGLDEVAFNDALTLNLRRGRFLLLIVGDGIREGVETIAEYLQKHAGLHFSFGLIELPIFLAPDGSRFVAPRVLARTALLTRQVVALPEGLALATVEDEVEKTQDPAGRNPNGDEQQAFWSAFLATLKLDDPEQPIPNPARQGYITFSLPAQAGSSWLTVYRDLRRNEVGLFLSSSRNSPGEFAMQTIVADAAEVCRELGGAAQVQPERERPTIGERFVVRSLLDPADRVCAFAWLAERVNTFVNVMRPRVRSATADYAERA